MQPVPAAVTAWRKTLSCTSPAAKTPLDRGAGAAGLRADIALGVQFELALEDRVVGRVADRDEHAAARSTVSSPVADIAETHAGHDLGLPLAQDFVDRAVPDHLDLRVREQPALQDLLGAEASRRCTSVTWSAWCVR